MVRTVWISRHAHRYDFEHPEWFQTAPRRYDPHLSAKGVRQAKELGERLKGEGIEKIFASPFRRTVETAHYVAEALDLPVALEWGIGEWLNPEWMAEMPETAPLEELRAEFPRIDMNYVSRTHPVYPEVSESICWDRSSQTAKQLLEAFSGNLLFVGHGATVAGMTRGLVGEIAEIPVAFCCLMKLVRSSDRWNLELNGDTSHLSETETTVRLN
ncbi:MAG: histidine phosphatase family protein [Cyanobacteria bacterium SBC]|nr:histidine phosphatase family protein [Cyanobacteria bacterium SBC]